jgi:hypothetical protein
MCPILKKILYFVIAIAALNASLLAQSPPPHIEWSKSFGGSDIDQALSIEQTADKGFIIAGLSNSDDVDIAGHHGTTDFSDYWIVKLDSNANLEWQRSLGGDSDDVANSIKQTMDGGYIVAGYSNSINGDVSGNHGGYDYWIVKLDDNGKIIWRKSYGGTRDDKAYSIIQTEDSGFVVVGLAFSHDGDISLHISDTVTTSDYWVLKLDKSGNLLWEKSFGDYGYQHAFSVRQTTDRGFIIAGHSEWDYWVIKISNLGDLRWNKLYGGQGADVAFDLDLTSDGGYIVAGYAYSKDGDVINSHGGDGKSDSWVIKIDSVGKLLWQKSLGGSDNDAGYSVKQTFDHGFIIAGNTASNDGDVTGNHGGNDYWVVKLDSLGNLQWQKTLGGSGEDFALTVIQTSDSGYVIAGSSDSDDGDITDNHSHEDYWIVKLGNKPVNGVKSGKNISSTLTNFPNPFSNKTQIQFGHVVESSSELIVYNVLGEEVGRIKIFPGTESITMSRGKLVTGVYVYHLVSDGMIVGQGRMVVQ